MLGLSVHGIPQGKFYNRRDFIGEISGLGSAIFKTILS